MTFKRNITGPVHFWSLAVEEHFYLFWPILIYYTPAKRLPLLIGSIVIFTIILRAIMLYNGFEVFYFTGTTMDALAIGAVLAVKENQKSVSKYSSRFYLGCLSLAAAGSLLLWLLSGGKGLIMIQTFKSTFIAFVYYLLILLLLNLDKESVPKKILNQKLLHYTGKISYGLYVYHILCFSIYSKYVKTSYLWFDFLSCFILSYIFASLSYYLFEVRFLSLKDKLSRKMIEPRPALSLQPVG